MIATVSLPAVLKIGGGAVQHTGTLIKELGGTRPIIVTDSFMLTTGVVDLIKESLEKNGLEVAVFSGTVPDPTTDSLQRGVVAIKAHGADIVIGLGGGSAIDTAKALGLLGLQGGRMRDYKAPHNNAGPAIPVVAIPTTAGSGSEATQFTIISDSETQEKMLCTGSAFLPCAAVLDYELTLSMPSRLTADTGIDALTHAIEAYVSRKANSFSDVFALSAIRTIGANLRTVYADGSNNNAREAMMLAATQAGIAFSNSSVALVHGMSRPIGAHFKVAHGLANAMLFPAVTEFSISAAEPRYADCARALGIADESSSDQFASQALVAELYALNRDLNVPTPQGFGIDRDAWEEKTALMAEQALASGSPGNNPKVPNAAQIQRMYTAIYA